MPPAIETTALAKRFGDIVAVDGVDLRVEQGEIYAFLGLNGAGKTTTIRMLLGMVRPTAGRAFLLGEAVGPAGHGPWARVGHLVEAQASYPELTARENLDVARRLHGVTDGNVTSRAIERLGLGPYADRRARTLSTGNLQRLGQARALMHDPEVVVLDEPSNGLDPAGVVEVRELLRDLVRERGTTVFMSSHVLGEVDRLATRIGIIHAGRLIEEVEADELERRRPRRLVVDARDRPAARGALEAAGYNVQVDADGALSLTEARALDAPEEVARLLVAAQVAPTRLAVEQQDLEAHFLSITAAAS